jgi:SulP family sulfate permease
MALKLFEGLTPLRWSTTLRDAIAGVTLASMDIPQVLGYARIAGMPVVTGLYTVLLPLVAFAIFGSSRHLVVAADSATATILASGLAGLAPAASAKYATLVGMTALLTAGFLLLARIFKLGFLADFLSRTVLVGFLSGVGVQIAIAMSSGMLGISTSSPHTVNQVELIADNLAQVHLPTFAMSMLVVICVVGGKRFLPRVPMPMLAVVGGIAASYYYDFASHGINILGPVPGGFPPFGIPQVSWRDMLSLLPMAASCFVMIIAQSSAASRSFAERHQERVDTNADILGLAAANAAAALSSAFVVNGSPSQTAMADLSGSRSQVGQLAFAAVVLIVLLFLTAPLQYLPRGVLAGIVFSIAIGLIDIKNLRAIRRESPGEFMLALVTAAAVALVGVEQGIMLAITLSLLRHVRHSYSPHTVVLVPDAAGQWIAVPAKPGIETEPGLIVYRFGADLFFANDARFADEVRALIKYAPTPVQWFVVDAGAITDVDYSAARSMRDLCTELTQRGIVLVFARVNAYLRADMDRHCITEVIGNEKIFTKLHDALATVPLLKPKQNGRGLL